MTISRSILLRMRNISDKSCTENQGKFYVQVNFFIRAVYETMWKNLQSDQPQMTMWRMRIGCWIPTVRNTHSEYVMITASPMQQHLQKTRFNVTLYIHCLSCFLESHETST
jgi:hypothetical protein